MKLDQYTRTLQGALQENKLTRYVLLGLTLSNVVLVFALATKGETVVMVPPEITQEARLASNNANAALKEAWASQVAMQLGNVTPRTAAYVSEQLGKIVAPSAYQPFMESLAEQADRIKDEQLTIQFAPTHVFYVAEKDLVVVSGEYAVRGLRDSEKRSVRTYEIGLDVKNYQVSVTSLTAYDGPWAPAREEQQRLQEQRERAEKRRQAMEEKRT
jgi:conjugal transfer pilus assembly protein TraE